MNEIRAHSLGDLAAIRELIEDEQRIRSMERSRREAGL